MGTSADGGPLPSPDMLVAARTLGLTLHPLPATNERDIDDAFAALPKLGVGGLLIEPGGGHSTGDAGCHPGSNWDRRYAGANESLALDSTGLTIDQVFVDFALGDQYTAFSQSANQQFLTTVAENAAGSQVAVMGILDAQHAGAGA
jgi:hypothetical protein